MLHYLIKRGLIYLAAFIAVLNVIFFLPRFALGNISEILAGNSRLPAVAVMQISERLGLNHPLYYQYGIFLKNIFLTFPPYLGVSYGYYPHSVTYLFEVRAVWSLLLIVTSLVVGQIMTYILGVFLSRRGGRKIETAFRYSLFTFNSVPLFWVSMILLYALAIYTHILPLFGNVTLKDISGSPAYYGSILWHMVLPVFALSVSLMGESFFLLRGSLHKALKSDYVLAAKSRGLTSWMVSSRYVLRNSFPPLVSLTFLFTAGVLSRLILIEPVFGYPGVGDLLVDGVIGRDYPVVIGSLFFFTLMVITGGLIGDAVFARLAPRLQTYKSQQ
ncbi:MAG: ABC transporter permease [Nitrososphaerales archaeon]